MNDANLSSFKYFLITRGPSLERYLVFSLLENDGSTSLSCFCHGLSVGVGRCRLYGMAGVIVSMNFLFLLLTYSASYPLNTFCGSTRCSTNDLNSGGADGRGVLMGMSGCRTTWVGRRELSAWRLTWVDYIGDFISIACIYNMWLQVRVPMSLIALPYIFWWCLCI